MTCVCGSADCPAAGASAAPVLIHLIAEQATVDGCGTAPGYLPGLGIQPAGSVRDLAATAKRKPAALADFIGWRDLTCRWPGCDARVCDIDHTVPYPFGPTHPSNLKLYCRAHHLVKTFYCGPGGWQERQYPDGTVTFTAPTGHRYTTRPAGAALFPALSVPTGVPDVTRGTGPPVGNRGLVPGWIGNGGCGRR